MRAISTCLMACRCAVFWPSCSLTVMHHCLSEEVPWSTCCVCYVTYIEEESKVWLNCTLWRQNVASAIHGKAYRFCCFWVQLCSVQVCLVGHAGSQSLGRQWWSSSVISKHAWWLTQQCSVIGSLVVASL